MARPKKSAATAATKTRKQYPPAFREEALKLAAVKGVAEAARTLEIQPALIYNWRRAAQAEGSRGELERELLVENARLKRQLTEREVELEILGKAPPTRSPCSSDCAIRREKNPARPPPPAVPEGYRPQRSPDADAATRACLGGHDALGAQPDDRHVAAALSELLQTVVRHA